MANIKKSAENLRKRRNISLSDREVEMIKEVSGESGLTAAIRKMIELLNRRK